MSAATSTAKRPTKAFVWGYNNTGELGLGHAARIATPAPALLPAGIVDLQGGASFSVALTVAGEVYTWGGNQHGQLGDGTTMSRREPRRVRLPGGAKAAAIAAGTDHVLVLTTHRRVVAWGRNHRGQLGFGHTDDRSTPQLITLEPVKKVAAGDGISVAISMADRLICWGRNHAGQLGLGDSASRAITKPRLATQVETRVIAVDAGFRHLVALTWSGQILMLGTDPSGRALTRRLQLKAAWGLVQAISAGEDHTVALTNRGTVLAWGANDLGQLGVAGAAYRKSPVAVRLAESKGRAVEVRAGHRHTLVRTNRHEVFAWGDGRFGAVGTGRAAALASQPTPARVPRLSGVTSAVLAGGGYTSAILVDRGPAVTLSLKPDRTTTKQGSPVRFDVRLLDAFGTDLGRAPGTSLSAPGATVKELTVTPTAVGSLVVIARSGRLTGRATLKVTKGGKR
ncbi:MAG: hypothetical protein QM711_18060 [Micropruina sp.]|uniref:RCC1 domain-containing protein n=1 Tax=Micropruina sp. TaxID=2737536 RepID=UPI0039E5D514